MFMRPRSYGKEHGQAQKDGKGSEHAFYPGNEPPLLPVISRVGSPTYGYQRDEASIDSDNHVEAQRMPGPSKSSQ